MAVFLSRRWRSQPQVPMEISTDWAPFFLFCHNFGFGRYGQEVVKKSPSMNLTKTGTPSQDALPSDRGPIFTAGTLTDANYLAGSTSASVVIPAGRCFAFVYARTGATSQTLACRSSASGTPILGLGVGANGASGTASRFNPIARDDASSLAFHDGTDIIVNDGLFHLLVIQRTATAWQYSMDGSALTNFNTTPTNAQGVITLTADRIAYGSDIVNGTIGVNASQVAVGGIVAGLEATPYLKDMVENPWMFFRPAKQCIYVNTIAAAAGGPFPHYTRRKLTGGMPIGVM